VNTPAYRLRPIRHVSSLASLLGLSEDELRSLGRESAQYWIPGKLLFKKDGDPRPTASALPPLKKVHRRIVDRICRQVDYPNYLMGGLPSDHVAGCRRHYEENARHHSGRAIVINEDIRGFYPSISTSIVECIWKKFFRFSPDVTEILTALVTYKGEVPQGWSPSSYLANLALWDVEPAVVAWLNQRGWIYTRWIDDITVSNAKFIGNRGKSAVIGRIYGMLKSRHFAPHRDKHRLRTSGQAQQVMGLNVVASAPTATRRRRANVRAAVANLNRDRGAMSAMDYAVRRDSVLGLVGSLKALHPRLAANLRAEVPPATTDLSGQETPLKRRL
jgi:hypothetical protein